MVLVKNIMVYDKTCHDCKMTDSEVMLLIKSEDLEDNKLLLSRSQTQKLINDLNKSLEPSDLENLFNE